MSLPYLLNLVTARIRPRRLRHAASELVGVRTREALRQLLLSFSRLGAPVLMVVEDLHWIDSASQSVLEEVVRSATGERLLCLQQRPQFAPPWSQSQSAHELRLNPLTNVLASEIIRERLEGHGLSDELVGLGVAKSRAIALREEFASYLSHKSEQASPGREGPAAWLRGDVDDIPTSLENLIMDRAASPRPGHHLAVASGLGARSAVPLASCSAGLRAGRQRHASLAGPRTGRPHLPRRLQRGDQPADYAFKHALVQDALYGSLLTPQRASLHQKAAEALEASYGEQASDVADVLAHHYVRTDGPTRPCFICRSRRRKACACSRSRKRRPIWTRRSPRSRRSLIAPTTSSCVAGGGSPVGVLLGSRLCRYGGDRPTIRRGWRPPATAASYRASYPGWARAI